MIVYRPPFRPDPTPAAPLGAHSSNHSWAMLAACATLLTLACALIPAASQAGPLDVFKRMGGSGKKPTPSPAPTPQARPTHPYRIAAADNGLCLVFRVDNDGSEPLEVRPEDIRMYFAGDRRGKEPVCYDAQEVTMDPLGFKVDPGSSLMGKLQYNSYRGKCAGNRLVMNPGGGADASRAVFCVIGGAIEVPSITSAASRPRVTPPDAPSLQPNPTPSPTPSSHFGFKK